MFRRRFAALGLAAGCLLSQAGCFGFFDRDRGMMGSGGGQCCGSGSGPLARWFGSGSRYSNAVPVSASSSVIGGDCSCSSSGIYHPVGLSGGMANMPVFPGGAPGPGCASGNGIGIGNGHGHGIAGIPQGVPVTVGEAMPLPSTLPIQPIPSTPTMPSPTPGTMQVPQGPVPTMPGGPPRIQPVPMTGPSGVSPSAGLSTPAPWQP